MFDLGGEADLGAGVDLGVIVPVDMGGGVCTIDCADTNPCTVAERCEAGACRSDVLDGDGDGFPSTICGGTDCDDSRATIAPGLPETCNGRDDNCSGIADEGSGASLCGGTMVCTGGMCRATEVCGELNATCCAGSTCNDSGLECSAGRCAARACAAPIAPIPFGAGAHCSVATRTCVAGCGSDKACFDGCLDRDTTPANPTSGFTCNQCINYTFNQCVDSGGCHSEFAAWACCIEDRCGDTVCAACDSLRTTLATCAESVTCTGVAIGCFP